MHVSFMSYIQMKLHSWYGLSPSSGVILQRQATNSGNICISKISSAHLIVALRVTNYKCQWEQILLITNSDPCPNRFCNSLKIFVRLKYKLKTTMIISTWSPFTHNTQSLFWFICRRLHLKIRNITKGMPCFRFISTFSVEDGKSEYNGSRPTLW